MLGKIILWGVQVEKDWKEHRKKTENFYSSFSGKRQNLNWTLHRVEDKKRCSSKDQSLEGQGDRWKAINMYLNIYLLSGTYKANILSKYSQFSTHSSNKLCRFLLMILVSVEYKHHNYLRKWIFVFLGLPFFQICCHYVQRT